MPRWAGRTTVSTRRPRSTRRRRKAWADTMTNGSLQSWRPGPARRAITDFVARTCGEDGSTPVPIEERIAVFDNHGTLWGEKPMPIQLNFILRRLAEMAVGQPDLRELQPWKAVAERDYAWFGAL